MLGKKRVNSHHKKENIKHKPLSEKFKAFNLNKDKNQNIKDNNENDESINSDIESKEDSEESNDNKNETNINTNKKSNNSLKNIINTNKIESYEDKRLRLAKTFLSKIEDNKEKDKDLFEESDNSSLKGSEESEDLDSINKKIIKQFQKSLTSFYENKNFNIKEASFKKMHKSSITDLTISKDGSFIVTCSKDCRGILYDVQKNVKTLLPKFTKRSLYSCCLNSCNNKTAYFGGKDRQIYEIDLRSLKLVQKFKAHNESITGLLFDDNKKQYYSIGNDHILKIWSAEEGMSQSICLETFYGHTGPINCLAKVPINYYTNPKSLSNLNNKITKLITCSNDGYVNLWKIDSLSFLQFNLNDIYPTDCISALNEDLFFTGNFNGSLYMWRTNKKKPFFWENYSHGYISNFKIKHWFFRNQYESFGNKKSEDIDEDLKYDENKINNENKLLDDLNYDYSDPVVEVGKPILSLECVPFSDLLMSGSMNGDINFYKINNKEDNFKFEKKDNLKIKNGGCINVMRYCDKGNYVAIGNGSDGKRGRWFTDYESKTGLTIIKLLNE